MPLDGAGDIVDSVEGGTTIPNGQTFIGPLKASWISGNSWSVGDTEPTAVLFLTDMGAGNAPISVDSTMTIIFEARSENDRSIGIVLGVMLPVPGLPGQVEYPWQPGDISVPGTQIALIHVTHANGTFTCPDDGYISYTVTSL